MAVAIDYPYGASGIHQKISQMTSAVYSGANEVDVVMSYSDYKESSKKFKKDIRYLSTIAHNVRAKIKIIIPTKLLTIEETIEIIKLCASLEVDYIRSIESGPKKPLKDLIQELNELETRWKEFGGGHMNDYARYQQQLKSLIY